MEIKELGHIVLYVSNLNILSNFYKNILGFKKISHHNRFAIFSSGRTHHELLLIEIGIPSNTKLLEPGLYHIGFKIGDSIVELKEAYESLRKNNVAITGMADHYVSKSIYIADPDGNELELYIDTNVDWKNNPELIATPAKPLSLD